MKSRTTFRVLRLCAGLSLFGVLFEGCSSDTAAPPPPAGPAGIVLTSATLCAGNLILKLALTNWDLLPPGFCGATPQCGSIGVTVKDSAGNVLHSKLLSATPKPSYSSIVVSNPVSIDLTDLDGVPSSIDVQFVDDAGNPFTSAGSISISSSSDGAWSFADGGASTCPDADGGMADGAAGAAGMGENGGSAGDMEVGTGAQGGTAAIGGGAGTGGVGGAAGMNSAAAGAADLDGG
jgi:hypothetical protein